MSSRLPIIFVVLTVVIDAMGIGLIMPVTPDLIREINGGDIANAAIWGGVLATGFAFMQFLCSPLLGSLSDRHGRRPILLISLVVMSGVYLVMAMAGSIWILLLGRLGGGFAAATQSTAAAYMADISTPQEKAKNFGLIGAGFGIGFVLGPVLGGLLAGYGTRAPFFAASAIAAGNALLGWAVLKETVTNQIRRPFEWSRANPLGALRSVAKLPGLTPLLLVFFFYQIATLVYPSTWSYFSAERFGWGPGMIGVSLALFGIFYATVQGLLVAPSLKYLGNRGTVLTGLGLETTILFFMGFVASGAVALGLTPFAALAAIGLPALQGIMSRRIPDNAQGELQGVLASVGSVGMIVSPFVMTQTFAYFSSTSAPIYFPGAAFLLSSALMVIAVLIFMNSRKPIQPILAAKETKTPL